MSVLASARSMIFRKPNTVVNICRQAEVHVIERFGRMVATKQPGLYVAIPLVDHIRVVCMSETCLPVNPLRATTQDNVMVETSGAAYVLVEDAAKALYGHVDPYGAVQAHVQSAMRVAIGKLSLDQCFHQRSAINDVVTSSIQPAAEKWGMRVLRYELTSLTPDPIIMQAMDKQAAAERQRREMVTLADARKRASQLDAEAAAYKLQQTTMALIPARWRWVGGDGSAQVPEQQHAFSFMLPPQK